MFTQGTLKWKASVARPMPVLSTIPEHAHCEICQRPVTVGERRCGSSECEAKFQAALKAKKRSVYLLIGMMALTLLFALYGTKLFGGA